MLLRVWEVTGEGEGEMSSRRESGGCGYKEKQYAGRQPSPESSAAGSYTNKEVSTSYRRYSSRMWARALYFDWLLLRDTRQATPRPHSSSYRLPNFIASGDQPNSQARLFPRPVQSSVDHGGWRSSIAPVHARARVWSAKRGAALFLPWAKQRMPCTTAKPARCTPHVTW